MTASSPNVIRKRGGLTFDLFECQFRDLMPLQTWRVPRCVCQIVDVRFRMDGWYNLFGCPLWDGRQVVGLWSDFMYWLYFDLDTMPCSYDVGPLVDD